MSETGHTERYNELYETDEPPAAIPVLTDTPVLRDAFATVLLSAQTSRMDSAAVKTYGVKQAAGCSPPAQVFNTGSGASSTKSSIYCCIALPLYMKMAQCVHVHSMHSKQYVKHACTTTVGSCHRYR